MKYYIAADGGGTKLFAVLYDQDFNIITYASCGGTNHLFRPKEEIERDVTLLADALIPDYVGEVEALDYSIVGNAEPLIEALQKKVVIRTAERSVSFSSSSEVTFRELDTDEIEYYVDTYRPFDKAGAYGIQEWIGCTAIESISGSFYNVMGLPVAALYKQLKQFV